MKPILKTISGGGETSGRYHAGVYEIDRAELKKQLRQERLKAFALMTVYLGISICCLTLLIVGE